MANMTDRNAAKVINGRHWSQNSFHHHCNFKWSLSKAVTNQGLLLYFLAAFKGKTPPKATYKLEIYTIIYYCYYCHYYYSVCKILQSALVWYKVLLPHWAPGIPYPGVSKGFEDLARCFCFWCCLVFVIFCPLFFTYIVLLDFCFCFNL